MPSSADRSVEPSFAKAVELGSIRKAALSQGVTAQAASQALEDLRPGVPVQLTWQWASAVLLDS